MNIFTFIKSLFPKKRYLIEYKVEKYTSNYIVKAHSEECAIEKFNKTWDNNMGVLYPYKKLEVISIKQIINKLYF